MPNVKENEMFAPSPSGDSSLLRHSDFVVPATFSIAWRMRAGLLAILSIAAAAPPATACPFCQATSQTLSEEIRAADVVILAKISKLPPPPDPDAEGQGGFGRFDPDTGNATFRIVDIIRGDAHLTGVEEIEVVYFGGSDKDKTFMISGIGTDRIDWTTPLPLSPAAEKYIRAIQALPEKGPDRIAFFQDFLESDDPLLSQDSYDEFARAPYADLIGMRDRMHHDQLIAWIVDPDVPPSRRRLYLTMLGVCGGNNDVPLLEYLIRPMLEENRIVADLMVSVAPTLHPGLYRPALHELATRQDRLKRQGLDALIACYLQLKGPDGLPLVEDLFLRDPNSEYKDVFSAIMALRFHGEETDVLPRPRLLGAMRLILDNPTFADQIIPDLARWEDWSVLDRLVEMFRVADETSYVRQPIVTYMTVASEQEGDVGAKATKALVVLEEIDPETVERARSLLAFGALARARPKDTENDTEPATAEDTTTETADDQQLPNDPQSPDDQSKTSAQLTKESTAGDLPGPEADGEDSAVRVATEEPKTDDPQSPAQEVAADSDSRQDPNLAPVTETAEELTPLPVTWVVVTPIVIGLALMACYWIILRGPSSRG